MCANAFIVPDSKSATSRLGANLFYKLFKSSATPRKPLNLRVLTAWLLVEKRNVRVDMTGIRRLRTLERDEKARLRVDIAEGF